MGWGQRQEQEQEHVSAQSESVGDDGEMAAGCA